MIFHTPNIFSSRGDHVTSTMLGSRPQFEKDSCDDWLEDDRIYANMPALTAPLQATPVVSLSCIYLQLRYLTDQMMQARSGRNSISDHDMRGFIKARNTIERSLLSLAPPTSIEPCPNVARTDYAFEAHRVSALIYLNIILRDCNPSGALLRALYAQLRKSIYAAEGSTTSWNRLSQMPTALWVYVMGGLFSLEDRGERWFAVRIKAMVEDLSIETWADIEGV